MKDYTAANQKTNYSINTMSIKQKEQAKLDKLLKDFEDCHRKAKRLKEEMRLLKIKIAGMPKVMVDERPDESK